MEASTKFLLRLLIVVPLIVFFIAVSLLLYDSPKLFCTIGVWEYLSDADNGVELFDVDIDCERDEDSLEFHRRTIILSIISLGTALVASCIMDCHVEKHEHVNNSEIYTKLV